jgi:hypothetical protein
LHVKKNVDFFVAKIKYDKPQILFDQLTIDKGDIPAIGEPTEFVFSIRNLGKSDLVIEDIKVSCGCLKSEKPSAPISSGKSDVIKLFYSVQPQRGVFTQTAAVKTNDPDNPVVVLSACGFTGVEVRIEPSRITLDRFFVGRKTSYRCFVRYTGEWNDFQVELESANLTGAKLVQHECLSLDQGNFADIIKKSKQNIPQSVAKNNRVLELTFEPTGNLSDNVSGTIQLKTNAPGYEQFTLHVSGTINSPIQTFPSVVSFDQDDSSIVTLVSIGESFRIVGIDCDSFILCRYDSSALQKEHTVNIKKTGNPQSSQITIKYKFDNNPTPHNLPITLINNNVK